MKRLKNKVIHYRNLNKALFQGELSEKLKRIAIKKSNLSHIYVKTDIQTPKELKIYSKFNNINLDNKFLFNLNSYVDIFEKKILIDDIDWFLGNKETKKIWLDENIKKYSDVKYVWEINRLQFLIELSIDAKQTKDKTKINKIVNILKGWNKENPYNMGINWFSNLEVAIRSISLVLIYSILGDELEECKIKDMLFEHGTHIYDDIKFSERCIPNNHVIGEAVTLYCLSHLLNFEDRIKWREKGEKILKVYLHHFRLDGTYEEASLSYHRFTLQMYSMVLFFSKVYKDDFLEKEIVEAMKNSYIFFKGIERPDGSYPDFGDNDNGYFYQIKYCESFENFVKSLGTSFDDNNYCGEFQILEKMFGVKIQGKLNENNQTNYFSEGKYVVAKDSKNYVFVNNQEQVYHSHSDGLSIDLFLKDKKILRDSGTFSYNLNIEKRNWYRGTRSHNTVYMGENQAKEIGSFRWINSPKNTLTFSKTKEDIKIYGMIETTNSKKHERNINISKKFERIIVEDNIENTSFVEVNWHFDSKINLIRKDKKTYTIVGLGYDIEINSDFKIQIELLKSPLSESYGFEKDRLNLRISNLEIKNKYKVTTIFIKKGSVK